MSKKRILLVLALVGLIYVAFWAGSHSFVELTPENVDSSDEVIYELVNTKDGKTTTFTAGQQKTKKLIKAGSYNIMASNKSGSYFEVFKANGFLRGKSISFKLTPQKEVSFVGSNPEFCASYINKSFVSYKCGDYYDTLKISVPATEKLPGYAQEPSGTAPYGKIEGFFESEGVNTVLLYSQATEGAESSHIAYNVNDPLKPSAPVLLNDLDGRKQYRAFGNGSGFVVHDLGFTEAFYYEKISGKPRKTILSKPKNAGLAAKSLDYRDGKYYLLFSSDNTNDKTGESEVVVYSDGKGVSIKIGERYGQMVVCDSNTVCLLSDRKMDYYELVDSSAKRMGTILGSLFLLPRQTGVIVGRSSDVLNFKPKNNTGYKEVNLGKYAFYSLQKADNDSYILGAVASNGRGLSMIINQGEYSDENMVYKLGELQSLPEIKHLSPSAGVIWVTQELGELQYIESSKIFGYEPEKIKEANEKILEKIKSLGIDQKKYRFIFAN